MPHALPTGDWRHLDRRGLDRPTRPPIPRSPNNVVDLVGPATPASQPRTLVDLLPTMLPSQQTRSVPVVPVPTIGMVASAMVFLVCAASFLIGLLTGFFAIFPPISLVAAAVSGLLYLISSLLDKQWSGSSHEQRNL
jgi:hypothetical protein